MAGCGGKPPVGSGASPCFRPRLRPRLAPAVASANRYLLVFDLKDGHCDRFARVVASQRYAASIVCFLLGLDF